MRKFGAHQLNSLQTAFRENGTESSVVFATSLVIYKPSHRKQESAHFPSPSKENFLFPNFLNYPSNNAVSSLCTADPVTPLCLNSSSATSFPWQRPDSWVSKQNPPRVAAPHFLLWATVPHRLILSPTPLNSSLNISQFPDNPYLSLYDVNARVIFTFFPLVCLTDLYSLKNLFKTSLEVTLTSTGGVALSYCES